MASVPPQIQTFVTSAARRFEGTLRRLGAMPAPDRPWLIPTAAALFAVACYLPSVTGGFVYDDPLYVQANPDVVGPRGFADAWFDGFPPKAPMGLYRPLAANTLHLDYLLAGGATWMFHLTNLLLHAGATLLVWSLLRRTRLGDLAAGFGAALFAAHPTHAESVAWISGRAEVLAGAMALAAILVGTTPRIGRRGLATAAVLMALAGFSKESAVVAPLLGAVWLHGVHSDLPRRRARLVAWGLGGLVPPIAKWTFTGALTVPPGLRSFGGMGFFERLPVAARLWGFEYPRMLLWPGAMHVDHPLFAGDGYPWLPVIVGFSGTALLAAAIARGVRRHRRWLVVVPAWFLISLLPHVHLLTSIGETAAQRFLFMGSFAFALGGALLFDRLRRADRPRLTAALCGVIIISAGLATTRSFDWRSDRALWQAEQERFPDSPRAAIALAALDLREAATRADQNAAARAMIAVLDRILERCPRHVEALSRRAMLALQVERNPRTAGALVSRLSEVNPSAVGLQTLRALVAQTQGRRAEALTLFERAREASPFDNRSRWELARAALREGRLDDAEVLLMETVEASLTPGNETLLVRAFQNLDQLRRRGAMSSGAFDALAREALGWLPEKAADRPRRAIEALMTGGRSFRDAAAR